MRILNPNIIMIILNIFRDVKSYLENILKYKYNIESLKLECPVCGCCLTYFSSYEVNYIDDENDIKIPVLRGLCRGCGRTHSLKPFFLPGKHQYAIKCRETAITAYQETKAGLKKALKAVFNKKQVSVMNLKYWLKTTTDKCDSLLDKILKSMQNHFPSIDIISDYIRQYKSSNKINTIYRLCAGYIRLFTGADPEGNFFSRFNIVNAVSSEECTGIYL